MGSFSQSKSDRMSALILRSLAHRREMQERKEYFAEMLGVRESAAGILSNIYRNCAMMVAADAIEEFDMTLLCMGLDEAERAGVIAAAKVVAAVEMEALEKGGK